MQICLCEVFLIHTINCPVNAAGIQSSAALPPCISYVLIALFQTEMLPVHRDWNAAAERSGRDAGSGGW